MQKLKLVKLNLKSFELSNMDIQAVKSHAVGICVNCVTGATKYPLFFCATRFVKSKSVADRAIEIWPNICTLVEFWEKLPSLKQPKSKSFLNVQESVKDKLILLKFEVSSFVTSKLKPYFLVYQTDQPMIPFMCSDLERLLWNIVNSFVKQKFIDKCSTLIQLKEIYIHKKDNLLKEKSIKLGFATEIRLTALRSKDTITNTDIEEIALTFMYDCLKSSGSKVPMVLLLYAILRFLTQLH